MTPGRRVRPGGIEHQGTDLADDGAERYMWAFSEDDSIVLSIPGLRDLRLSENEALTIGKLLIDTASDILISRNQKGKNEAKKEE